MVRRVLLTLCIFMGLSSVGLWVRSYFRADSIFISQPTAMLGVISVGGGLEVVFFGALSTKSFTTDFDSEPASAMSPSLGGETWLGFGYGSIPTHALDIKTARLPIWSITAASALLALWLWRKGRRRAAAGGFEIRELRDASRLGQGETGTVPRPPGEIEASLASAAASASSPMTQSDWDDIEREGMRILAERKGE